MENIFTVHLLTYIGVDGCAVADSRFKACSTKHTIRNKSIRENALSKNPRLSPSSVRLAGSVPSPTSLIKQDSVPPEFHWAALALRAWRGGGAGGDLDQ